MNKNLVMVIALVAAALLLGGCKPAPAHRTIDLTLDWKPEPEFGGFYQADLSGAFKSRNLDVRLQTAGAGAPTWQLVATGQTLFATTAADQVLIARARGADVVALFAVYQTFPQGIMTHRARGFKTLRDVFTSSGTIAAEDDSWLKFLLNKFQPIKATVTGYSGGIGAFLAKPDFSQQCFVTSEPLLAAAQGSDPQTFLIADAGYNPYTTVLITSGKTIRESPAVVKSFVDACREGWRAYLDDPTGANQAMEKLNAEMAPDTYTRAAAAQKPLIETDATRADGLGIMSSDRWNALGGQLVQLHVIDKAPSAEQCFIDPRKL